MTDAQQSYPDRGRQRHRLFQGRALGRHRRLPPRAAHLRAILSDLDVAEAGNGPGHSVRTWPRREIFAG